LATPALPPAAVSFATAFLFWLKLDLISFGGQLSGQLVHLMPFVNVSCPCQVLAEAECQKR
jgi:hypothetical protein